MNIQDNVDLSQYSTMRLGGQASHLVEVSSQEDISAAVAWAEERQLPILAIGGGSNIVWRDEGFAGLVIVNQLLGYSDESQDENTHIITIAAGENWDSVVERSVADGLTGIEALSLIPGTTGGTPVQNVGAYGQEIADVLIGVSAYDRIERHIVTILAADCGFAYRTSRFKTTDRGRYIITAITLRLQQQNPTPPFYRAVEDYFTTHAITDYTPDALRRAVIAIRSSKLPDPKLVANNGSFFANPIIGTDQTAELLADYPDMPHWPGTDGQVKIPAAWLIEQAGFKDYHDPATGMATWASQPLVLVNKHARSTADLLSFKQKIVDAVQAKFGVTLEQEPELLP